MRSGLAVAAMLVALLAGAIVIIMLVRVPDIYAVEATGQVKYTPDEADISVGYYTEAAVSADAVKRAAATMRAVLAALRTAGVTDAAIASTSVRSDLVSDDNRSTTPSDQRKPIYFAYQAISVDVKDLTRIGPIIDAISKAGANYWLVKYKVSDKRSNALRDAVHRAALANAIAMADAHAHDGKFQRGRILKIRDGETSFPEADYYDRDYDMGERRRGYEGSRYMPRMADKVVVTGSRLADIDTTFDIPPPKEASVTTIIDVLFEMK